MRPDDRLRVAKAADLLGHGELLGPHDAEAVAAEQVDHVALVGEPAMGGSGPAQVEARAGRRPTLHRGEQATAQEAEHPIRNRTPVHDLVAGYDQLRRRQDGVIFAIDDSPRVDAQQRDALPLEGEALLEVHALCCVPELLQHPEPRQDVEKPVEVVGLRRRRESGHRLAAALDDRGDAVGPGHVAAPFESPPEPLALAELVGGAAHVAAPGIEDAAVVRNQGVLDLHQMAERRRAARRRGPADVGLAARRGRRVEQRRWGMGPHRKAAERDAPMRHDPGPPEEGQRIEERAPEPGDGLGEPDRQRVAGCSLHGFAQRMRVAAGRLKPPTPPPRAPRTKRSRAVWIPARRGAPPPRASR